MENDPEFKTIKAILSRWKIDPIKNAWINFLLMESNTSQTKDSVPLSEDVKLELKSILNNLPPRLLKKILVGDFHAQPTEDMPAEKSAEADKVSKKDEKEKLITEIVDKTISLELLETTSVTLSALRTYLTSNGFPCGKVESLQRRFLVDVIKNWFGIKNEPNRVLQDELDKYGKSKTGTKEILLQRLKEALVDQAATSQEDKQKNEEKSNEEDKSSKKDDSTANIDSNKSNKRKNEEKSTKSEKSSKKDDSAANIDSKRKKDEKAVK